MLISWRWLSALAPLPDDPRDAARRLTARGLTVDAVTPHGDDTVLDIDVPANRPDALGHVGVARELCAAYGVTLGAVPDAPQAHGEPADVSASVRIADPALCGRYTARVVRDVRVGPSPAWVARRLEACGLRSINNVVDVSNLVMLELGQPVHFFDLARIEGAAIEVRAARAAERLITLDGIERSLAPGMIVIADAAGPIALGGLMGGAGSQITERTRDILIEAAWFSPPAVRAASRALGLITDASQRFERGSDPDAPPLAQALAVRLLAELAAGTPAPGTIDVRPVPPAARTLSVRLSRASALLGYEVAATEAAAALAALGLSPAGAGDTLGVTVPSWRVDLTREADLVEEIGRHLGYDRIPAKMPAEPKTTPASATYLEVEQRAADRLAALGFLEAVNYAMIGKGEDDPFVPPGSPPALALANPISESLGHLRRSLLPGLLRATDQNLRRGADEVRLFEIGAVFLDDRGDALPDQPLRAGFAWSGPASPPHWSAKPRPVDPWDAFGVIDDVLAAVSGPADFDVERSRLAGLHPGRSRLWSAAGVVVAWCGPLHPDLAARLDLSSEVWLGELDLSALARTSRQAPRYVAFSRQPAIGRDLSLVFSRGASSADALRALRAVPSPAPVSLRWVDRYAGAPLGAGEAAMTLRVILQPLERTLTDADAEGYREKLIAALEPMTGIRLRRMDE